MNFFETAVILRPFFIYGPGQRNDMFIARLIESVKSGKSIQLQGEEGLRVNPLYVEDAAVTIANSLDLTGSHIINLAGPDILTLKEVSGIIGQILNRDPIFEYQKGIATDYIGNMEQAVIKLDHPMNPFTQGIEQNIKA